jgi:hypothetical protein
MKLKFKAIIEIIFCSNYIVTTDKARIGSVSPIYAEVFQAKLMENITELKLSAKQHEKLLAKISDLEFGEVEEDEN